MKLRIPILLGTTRQDRQSEKVAALLAAHIADTRDDIESVVVDVRDFALPLDNYGQDIKGQFPEWQNLMENADGLILVLPEYNHGYPGPMKSVLDLLLPEYNHKVAGLVGVSAGPWGGVRVIENILPVLRELGLVASSIDLNFARVRDAFGEDGAPTDPKTPERMDRFLDELVFLGKSLRWGRTGGK